MTACTRCTSPLEDGDLRCAICALPAPAPPPYVIERARVQVLRCHWCHAAVEFVPEARAPRCAFCGSTMEVEQPVDPLEVATLRVPFAVDREAAERSLRGWLRSRGWFAPRQLHDEAVLESLAPLGWAAWIVHARAQVTWTADSDRGARRSVWAPHAGETHLTFDGICVPASRGLPAEDCHLLAPFYDLGRAVPVADEAVAADEVVGPVVIERFDAQRSAARVEITRALEATAKTRVERDIPGRRYRNVHVACLLEGQTTQRVALPAWVLAYRYRDRPYRAIVHGQRAEVVFGTAPRDWRKVLAVAIAAAALVAIIALLVAGR